MCVCLCVLFSVCNQGDIDRDKSGVVFKLRLEGMLALIFMPPFPFLYCILCLVIKVVCVSGVCECVCGEWCVRVRVFVCVVAVLHLLQPQGMRGDTDIEKSRFIFNCA